MWGRVVVILTSIKIWAYSFSRMLMEVPRHVLEHEVPIHTDRRLWDKVRKFDLISGQGPGRIC